LINFANANKYSIAHKLRFCEFLHSADTPVVLIKNNNPRGYKLKVKMYVYYCNTGSDIRFKFRKFINTTMGQSKVILGNLK